MRKKYNYKCKKKMSEIEQSNQVTLEQALNIAKTQMQMGNFFVAEQTYNDILKAFPNEPECYYGIGLVNFYKQEFVRAKEYFEKVLGMNKESTSALNMLAASMASLGQYDNAISTWEKLLKLNDVFVEAYSGMCNAYRLMRKYNKAIEAGRKSVSINENFAAGWVNLGAALIMNKEFEEAVPVFEKAMELLPELPHSYINLSNAYHELGQLEKAEEMGRKAIELAPQDAIAHNNLGNALMAQAQYEEAEEILKKAVTFDPKYVDAHCNLALVYMDTYRFEEAAAACKYAISFDDKCTKAYGHLATCYKELKDFANARRMAEKAAQLEPESPMPYVSLAEIMYLEDRYEEAEIVLKKAMELGPDTAVLNIRLADILEKANKFSEAIEALDKAEELNPEMPQIAHKKSTIYFVYNHLDKAMEALDKSLSLKPDYVPAIATKSEVLQSLGRMEEAYDAARQGMELNDTLPFLYFTMSKVKKFTEDDTDFKKMLKLVEKVGNQGREQEAALNFALYKAWTDIGDHIKAFEVLKKANDAKREVVPHSLERQRKGFANVKRKYTKEFVDSLEDRGYDDETPILIVGMPRSGTTLTEQILASHPDVYGAGELPDLSEVERINGELNPDNCELLGKQYVERVKALSNGEKFVSDKMPGNFMRVGQIITTMPNAKIIHCMRDPIDTCLSCYKQLFARGQYWSYDLEEMADFYNSYKDLMAYWHKMFPNRILDISYEDTVSNFEPQVRKLLDFVGLEWNDACLTPHKSKRPILTASKGQVRKPIYKTSVKAWKRYEEQLQPLIQNIK